MKDHSKYCIFCFRKSTELPFSREHIIPQNVGGNLFIDEVCVDCNSNLGRFIDIQVLKYPEILKAFEFLKIPHNKEGILKNYYKITGKSGNLEFPATYHDGKYKMLPKSMSDGSMIFPEEDYFKNLNKKVKRDIRLKSLNLSKDYINDEMDKIKEKYDKAKPGEIIKGDSIGRSILKRRDKFTLTIEPKGKCEIERLIAKIYYEFLYFVERNFIFKKAIELEPIFNLINKGEKSNIYYFSRPKSKLQTAIPTHLIRFIFKDTFQQLYISFFGILDFSFITFFHYSGFWKIHEEQFKCSNINGVHFEQNIQSGDKNFWFIDDKHKLIRSTYT